MIDSRASIPVGWISVDDAVELSQSTGRRFDRDRLYANIRKGRLRCVKDARPWLIPITFREELAALAERERAARERTS